MRLFASCILFVFTSFWRNRHLILQMTKREVVGRYRGSLLGLAWSFLTPLIMLAIYTFVFGVVFKSRWGLGPSETRIDFALILFVGLIVHGLFAECVNRAPGLVLQHASFVKRVVFPLEILPWVVVGAALFHAAVSVLMWILFAALTGFRLSPTALFLPLVFVPLVLMTMGLAWFLASAGVYLRDVGHTVVIFTTVVLFLTPIFFPLSAIPDRFRSLVRLNPLTLIVEQARAVLTAGAMPDFRGLAFATAEGLVVATLGLWWFQKTRRGFADVL